MLTRNEAIQDYKLLRETIKDVAHSLEVGCSDILMRISLNDTIKKNEAKMAILKAGYNL